MFNFFSRLPTVLLYVRTGADEVFDALMLNTPTLSGLREAVSNTLINKVIKPDLSPLYKHTLTHIHIHAHVALTLPYVISHIYHLSFSGRSC